MTEKQKGGRVDCLDMYISGRQHSHMLSMPTFNAAISKNKIGRLTLQITLHAFNYLGITQRKNELCILKMSTSHVHFQSISQTIQ